MGDGVLILRGFFGADFCADRVAIPVFTSSPRHRASLPLAGFPLSRG
jgi:hypothetical protein